jgi:transposase InsO family protein
MCTAPQGATNSVAHVSNAMNKIFCDFIPEIVYPFIDDLPIKGCAMEEKKSFYVKNGVRKFVYDHLQHVDSVLKRLIEVRLTLSVEKSKFAVPEIKVVGQICGTYGRKPCANNVLGIVNLQPCKDQHEVRRFLGACSFYRIWIPHYAHVAEPLYQLLRKQNIFKWTEECQDAQDSLKNSLMSDPIYGVKERPLTLTVDTSPTAIGWVLRQNDESGHRYASRYGAKVLNQHQRNYAQVKRELWGLYTALKVERVHVIGSLLIIETDCKPLLGMVTNSDTHDIAMLRWISYIRTFDATIIHISGKLNHVADMLSRAKLKRENEPEETSVAQKSKIYAAVTHVVEIPNEEVPFQEDEYEGDLQKLGLFICNRYKTKNAVDERNIKRIAQKYFLKNGQLWKKPLSERETPRRVICLKEQKKKILEEFHNQAWAGHRSFGPTYLKIKERFYWKGLYRHVKEYVETCEKCQMYSKVKVRGGLHPTYPSTVHFKWSVDLVHLPKGIRGMKYLVLAREDLTNMVEGRALRNKRTEGICRFLLEDLFSRYGYVFTITADRGELNADEARTFFSRLGVRLRLTTAWNPESNGKIERGHQPIVSALVKSCDGKPKQWPNLLPLALWADRMTHCSTTGFMPCYLATGVAPIFPTEENILSWAVIPWSEKLTREELLSLRIRQLQNKEEDIEEAAKKLKQHRLMNKARFDKTHRLRSQPLVKGDWVIVLGSSQNGVKKC